MAKETASLIVFKKEELARMLGELPFTSEQFNMLMAPTPKKFIKSRQMPGGGSADFVSGHYVTNVLNFVTAYKWSFEVLSEKEKYGQIVVEGKLSFPDNNGGTIVKTQYGRANIKFYSEYIKLRDGSSVKRTDGKAGQPVDYGNDFKAAATDALKKCASLVGVAWDVYGNEDFKQMKVSDEPVTESSNNIPHEPVTTPINDIRFLVDTKLSAMEAPEKMKFLKDNVGTITEKNLTDEQYRDLYKELAKSEAKGNV